MTPQRILALAVPLVMTSLGLWYPPLCAAQLYSGSVISQDEHSIKLNVGDPCGKQVVQTISPYKIIGDPTKLTCPNGKQYSKVMVAELPANNVDAQEFSGEILSESKDAVTLDKNPCGEKKAVTVSPYKKTSSVDVSCPNGRKYTKVTVEKLAPNGTPRAADPN